jgi:hypothetical protein
VTVACRVGEGEPPEGDKQAVRIKRVVKNMDFFMRFYL